MASAPPRAAELAFADVFADVFGGPPRRSSGNERRVSMDSTSFGSSTPRAPSGGPEAPVFGDRGSGDRRRHPGEEFYRDIFPATEAASPRRAAAGDWGDVFGGPASPIPTTRPRSSFSMKFNGGAEISMPTSPSPQTSNREDDGISNAYSVSSSPNSQMNNYLAPETPQEDSRKKPFSWNRYPFLSRLRSQSGDKKNTSNHVSSMGNEGDATPVSMENNMATNKFHFSFYKWAGKGALLVLPGTMEEKDASIVGLESFPQVVVRDFDVVDEEDNMSTATAATKGQTDYEDSKSEKYSTNSTTKEEPVPSFFDNDYMQGLKHGTDYSKNDDSSQSPSTKSSRPPSGGKSHSSRVKRKVKDFMKIFSPQGSPKRKGAPEVQDQISSEKIESKAELQDNFTLSGSEANDDVKINQNSQNVFMLPPPVSVKQERMEKPVLTTNSTMDGKMDMTSARNEAVPNESSGGGRKDGLDNTIFNHGESHVEDLDGCLVVEYITEDPFIHNDQEKDKIKIAESKIREWSRGKEGNIRSLLSTLQYVLWPESGWKPIPLVDVIEGAAVKKAYQKALLCLHPDKLQQRGAAMHQKYIAEKVFDILQESWKEFNSVTFG